MKNYYFKEISVNEFDKYSKEKLESSSFQQTEGMAKTLTDQGWTCEFLAVFASQDTLPLLTALVISKKMMGGFHMELNYGPIYKEYNEDAYLFFLEELKNYAKKKNVLELVVRPNIDAATYASDGSDKQDVHSNLRAKMEALSFERSKTGEILGWQYAKDLQPYVDYKALFKSFTKDGQYSIKKTRQFGIKVRKMSYDELAKFKEVTLHTAKRRGYEDKSLTYYQDVYKNFEDLADFLVAQINFKEYKASLLERKEELEKNLLAIEEFLALNPNSRKKNNQKREQVAEISTYTKRIEEADDLIREFGQEDIIASVGLFIYSKSELVYLFSGSYDKYKKFYAPFAIQEFVMKKAMDQKISRYNFYGISGIFDGSDGVLGFKQNFKGYIEEKIGDFTYYPNKLKYKVITTLKSLLGRG
ncbi:peptidoglycan bridge formation glycyltransferase FemA/FemB family protein [Streptococcaceae bacterium ESL0729]|nr:peptidoglycan bridge formation glycyltransferase FemA/FemB family protein [Streptococcaceae bacterium ESL0729]